MVVIVSDDIEAGIIECQKTVQPGTEFSSVDFDRDSIRLNNIEGEHIDVTVCMNQTIHRLRQLNDLRLAKAVIRFLIVDCGRRAAYEQ